MSDAVDCAIYVGSIDHFMEGGWLPRPPLPPLPEGMKVTVLRVIGQTDRKTQQEKIKRWRDRMTTELGNWLSTPLDWDETERQHAVAEPGGTCWMALMLWAAYAEFHEEPPVVVGPSGLASNDPVFQRLKELPEFPRFRQIVQCIDYWLPASFDTVLQSSGPQDESAFIGSSPVLLAQLQALNQETWRADRATIAGWSEAGKPVGDGLEAQARYAFAELLLAAQYSCDHGMPMAYYFDVDSLSPDLGA
jgi:hypothetical protein